MVVDSELGGSDFDGPYPGSEVMISPLVSAFFDASGQTTVRWLARVGGDR
jgi:hypothetical protein